MRRQPSRHRSQRHHQRGKRADGSDSELERQGREVDDLAFFWVDVSDDWLRVRGWGGGSPEKGGKVRDRNGIVKKKTRLALE